MKYLFIGCMIVALAACQKTQNEAFEDAWKKHQYPERPMIQDPQDPHRVRIWKEYGNDAPDPNDE